MIRTLPLIAISGLIILAQPALARKKLPPEPRPCPVDETIRIASAESFARLQSLAGCQDNVIEAMADPEEELETLPAPVRLRPDGYWPVASGADADEEGAETAAPVKRRVDARKTPSIRIVPPRDEAPDGGAFLAVPSLQTAGGQTAGGMPGAPASGAESILSQRPLRAQSVHDETITQIAWRHRVDPLLLHAVIKQESGYRHGITSHAGARGLMQIMPGTGAQLGVASAHLFDPTTNVDAGARLLRKLAIRYKGDFSLVLAAYNAGEGAVAKYGNTIPPYRETQNYVRSVMAHYNRFVAEQHVRAVLN